QPQELLAFGDANNDIEMLALTPYSYAMAECSPEVADVANYRAPSNDESGVLQVIERYLKQDNDTTN
ncbi:hydrolase, partial [bacterium M00.F.Ca.ET.177.01.1.1]